MAHTTSEPPASTSLHYLTLQDMLWINLQVTKKVNGFDYAKLEEAVFYQYAYGSSHDLVKQAAQLAAGFKKQRPFAAGNEATCFVGLVAFLHINGMRVSTSDSDAAEWFARASQGGPAAAKALTAGIEADPNAHPDLAPNVEESVEGVLAKYSSAIATLLAKE